MSNGSLRCVAAIVGLAVSLAAGAADRAPESTGRAKAVPTKPERGAKLAPVRSAMRATLNPDGTLSYECSTVPHPGHDHSHEPTAAQLREER